MSELLAGNLHLITSAISLAILVAIYFSFKTKIDFWWLNFWYSLPVIGKVVRLSRNHTTAAEPGWYIAERTLCKDYKQHIHFMSRDGFNNYLDYLRKAEDNGRSPIPLGILVIMVALVAAEGLGFSYLLGTWMATEGSANTHTILMVAIVSVLATILAFLTHAAGHQLYRSSLVKRSLKGWRQSDPKPDLSRISLSLKDDQRKDDRHPDYVQVLVRVGREYSYVMVGIAAAAIILIASLSTWMRYENLVRTQTAQTMGQMADTAQTGNPFANAAADKLVLPTEVTQSQAEAQKQGQADSASSMKSEGIAAFLTLAIIFIVTQIVGIYAGFKWGFAGKESKSAYNATRGFSTYEEFLAYYEPRIDAAQAMLQRLQQKISADAINSDKKLSRTFRDYLLEERKKKDEFDQAERSLAAASTAVPPEQTTVAPAREESLDALLNQFDAIGDKDEKKRFITALPATQRDALMAQIKLRKESEDAERQRAEQARLDAELDNLLD